MAITLSTTALLSALRLSDTPEENTEATRLLAFATQTISDYLGDAYAGASSAILNESAIRISGYLFDMPYASRGAAFANALRNSGAGAMLLPFRVHRAGSVAEATAAAQEAIGSTGNPVVDVQVSGSSMKIVFADGTTRDETLPSGMGGGPGEDATARASAATAQSTANAAQAEIDAHEGTLHNTDQTARDAAEQAQTAIETHEASTHNHDAGARTAAANAQSAIEDHERTTHNTDTVARNAAATAQAAAEAAAGGRPTVIYEAATVAIGGNTGLISSNVACPGTGDLEFYFRQVTGDRQGSIAYAKIPAADVRAAVSALSVAYNNDNVNVRILALGANRGIGIAVQATTNFLLLTAQSPGNYFVRVVHLEG